ncbi:methionine adenosyltransferase [Candidatus Peregrinibacteria bacterium]|nr:methionine adenosyltransferase [Candidatus Peregrinibacteria bacterium]
MTTTLFTSESVTEGHPDKICDQISDAVLDEALRQDPNSRVAVECAAKTGLIFLFGEMTTNGYVDFQSLARNVVKKIGYTRAKFGFDYETCGVISSISEQSPEISHAVKHDHEIGAGDQGMMFGYACTETPELMPLPIMLAHGLTKKLAEVRKDGTFPELRPDGKSQVTVEYHDGKAKRVHTVVISTQHDPNISQEELAKLVKKRVIGPVLKDWLDAKTIYHINPSGSFIMGGPQGDAGLTGRKIIVDTYGGYAPHGGGCFSGKDPSKVDRSGAYAARYMAKNIVAAGLAEKCQIEISYAIGIAEPVSILVETFRTSTLSSEELEKIIRENFPIKPGDIIRELELRLPIYLKTATYGHFGRDDVSWEKTDRVDVLRKYVK